MADAQALQQFMPQVQDLTLLYPLGPELQKVLAPGFADHDFAKSLKPNKPGIIKPGAN